MDALQALLNRVSIAKVAAPAPDETRRQAIFAAALRAADHGQMRPWRFLVVEGQGLVQLGELFAEAALAEDSELPSAKREKFKNMPLRAPLVIVVIAVVKPHPKVPGVEQVVSAGAAVQNMITAAYALGTGAFWRTGEMAYNPHVMKGLGLTENEQIVGYLYLGTPVTVPEVPTPLNTADFFHVWPPK